MQGRKKARSPILAAGGVVLRSSREPLIAVVQLRKYNDWVLPKGKINDDESALAAARREVQPIGRPRQTAAVHLGPAGWRYLVDLLGDVRVLDLAGEATAQAGRMLADLGVGAGVLKLQSQRDRVVNDPHRRELLTGLGLTHDHRPLPMQIDPDELLTVILVHRGLP